MTGELVRTEHDDLRKLTYQYWLPLKQLLRRYTQFAHWVQNLVPRLALFIQIELSSQGCVLGFQLLRLLIKLDDIKR